MSDQLQHVVGVNGKDDGLSIEHWGTPHHTGDGLMWFWTGRCVRPGKYEPNQFITSPSRPNDFRSRWSSVSWSTVSNAADTSSNTSNAKSSKSIAIKMSASILRTAVAVEWLTQYADWRSRNELHINSRIFHKLFHDESFQHFQASVKSVSMIHAQTHWGPTSLVSVRWRPNWNWKGRSAAGDSLKGWQRTRDRNSAYLVSNLSAVNWTRAVYCAATRRQPAHRWWQAFGNSSNDHHRMRMFGVHMSHPESGMLHNY